MNPLWSLIVLLLLAFSGCLRGPMLVPRKASPAERPPEPIAWALPDDPDAFTEQKLARQTAASLARQMNEAHRSRGLPCPGAEDALAAFFDDMGAWQAKLPNAPSPELLLTRAESLRAVPCDDPALLHGHGLLLQAVGRHSEAFDLFLQAAARYAQLGFPGVLKARNAVAIYTAIHQIGDAHDKDQCFRWKDRALEFMAQGIARDALRPEDLRPLYAHIDEHWKCIYWTRDGDSRHIVARRIEELGGGDPWLVQMMLGRDAYRKAWVSRGGGFADTVTDEGWKGFRDHYATALAHLRAALDLHPEFPEPSNFLIDIAGAGRNPGPESAYDFFRRAVDAQIDYWPAYQSFVFHTLPRWGGTPEKLAVILRMVSENQRFDTRLPQYALAIYKTLASDRIAYPGPWARRGITVHPWRDPEGWTMFRRIYEGYLRHPDPIPYERGFLLRAYLNYAHQFDQPREFLRILEEHAPSIPLDPDAFERAHGYPPRLAEAMARLQLDHPTAWAAFADPLDHRDFPAAERALLELESIGADPDLLSILRRALVVRTQLEPEPGWLEQHAFPTLHPWTEHRGVFHAAFAGAYLGTSQDERNLVLLNQPTNGGWEIAADAVILSNSTPAAANAALFFAKDKTTFVSLAIYPATGEAVLSSGPDTLRATLDLLPPPARNRMRLRLENHRFSAWINGTPVFTGKTLPGFAWSDAFRLGLGGLYPSAGAAVLFENVRLRPLPPAPSLLETP